MEPKKDIDSKSTVDTSNQKPKIPGFFNNTHVWVAALAIIVIVIFSSFLFDGGKMLYGSDTMAGLDSKVFYRTAITKFHQFPLWFNPRLSGMPTIDALFGDAFYPPSFAFFSVMPIHRALGMRLVFHVFLAGLFFFLLLRKGFGAPGFVAFIGAAFYMLNPEFFSHVYPGHDGKMFVIAWLPFVVWMLKSMLDKPRLLTASFFAAGIAICLYTSHIQMTYFTLWGLFLYWLMHAVMKWRSEKKITASIGLSVYFWLAVFTGVGLAFVQIFPSFMFIRDAFSVRGVERGFDYAASWSLHWPEAFSLWVPEFGNTLNYYWSANPFKLNSEYAGAMATLFAVIAIAAKAKPWRLFWGGVSLVTVLYSLGAHTPVFHIAYALIPGVKKFRACSMLMFWFSFGTILLTGLFLKDVVTGLFDEWSERRKKKWQKGILVAIGCITGIALLFSVKGFVAGIMQPLTDALSDRRKEQIFDANFSKNFVPCLWLWWFFAATSLGLLWGVIAKKVNPNVFCAIVLIIGLIDIIRIDMPFVNVINPRPYMASEPAIDELKAEMQEAPFRCFTLPGSLNQNAEGIHSLEGVSGFHDNELAWYREFRGDQQDRNFFDKIVGVMADGRPYLIPENLKNGNAFLNIANAKYYLIRQGEQLLKIKNEAALGRISFAKDYVVLDSSRVIDALHSGAYDVRKTVAFFKEPTIKPAVSGGPIGDSASDPQQLLSVKWEKYTPNYRRAAVSVKQDGFLRISEVYYPGWEMRIDSKKVPILRADLAWMALNISKGDHIVEMFPHSLYLKKAELVSYPLLALLGLYWTVMLAVSRLRKRNRHDNKE